MAGGLLAAEAAGFRKNGYHFPLRLLTEAEAGECRHRVEEFERAHPDAVGKLDLKANLLFPWVDAITRHPKLLDAVESLLGPDLICWNATFRNKKARSPTYAGWHQDSRYITVRPTGVIAMMAVTPANAASGTVRVIPGSNNWQVLDHRDTHDTDSLLTRGQYITTDFDKSTAIDLSLRPGEVAFFDHNTVHGSGPNASDDRRLILLMGFFATQSKPLDGKRVTAFTVRGHDAYGHFDADRRPTEDYGPAERDAHRRAVEAQVKKVLFDGSDRTSIALN
jgi:hypothetical protein